MKTSYCHRSKRFPAVSRKKKRYTMTNEAHDRGVVSAWIYLRLRVGQNHVWRSIPRLRIGQKHVWRSISRLHIGQNHVWRSISRLRISQNRVRQAIRVCTLVKITSGGAFRVCALLKITSGGASRVCALVKIISEKHLASARWSKTRQASISQLHVLKKYAHDYTAAVAAGTGHAGGRTAAREVDFHRAD